MKCPSSLPVTVMWIEGEQTAQTNESVAKSDAWLKGLTSSTKCKVYHGLSNPYSNIYSSEQFEM